MHCHACSVSLHLPEFKGPSGIYCKYCTDDQRNLKSFEEVRDGIPHWFTTWQGTIRPEVAKRRAESFMRGLTAWVQD